MKNYLGEFPVDIANSQYKDHTPDKWALEWIFRYGQIDGSHHKAWVLDQVAQILHGTPVIVVQAKWEGGHTEYRLNLGPPSEEYLQWVEMYKGPVIEDTGLSEYDYCQGTPP